MRITHTTKEIVSSIDISLYSIQEAHSLFAELEFLDRRYPFSAKNDGGLASLPNLDNLIRQLKSKIEGLGARV